eukprot:TRINITY_DN10000_c0_g1_i2.p1 TRINITY_DN10000_c0_g1~~TRINITY_DN10000_c0_g1_i2.p1  ORF type:complete len:209 (+),score=11.20 TRINITY_DN10000_c0_g1_i2:62-688(+)
MIHSTEHPLTANRRRTRSAPARLTCRQTRRHRASEELATPKSVLNAIRGQAGAVAAQEHGIRFLQIVVDNGSRLDITHLIDELSPVLGKLAMDVRAQQFLECVVEKITNPYQTRQFCRGLRRRVFQCLKSQPALAILERCVRRFVSREVAFVFDAAALNVASLLKSPEGRRLLEACLSRERSQWNDRLWTAVATHTNGRPLGLEPMSL